MAGSCDTFKSHKVSEGHQIWQHSTSGKPEPSLQAAFCSLKVWLQNKKNLITYPKVFPREMHEAHLWTHTRSEQALWDLAHLEGQQTVPTPQRQWQYRTMAQGTYFVCLLVLSLVPSHYVALALLRDVFRRHTLFIRHLLWVNHRCLPFLQNHHVPGVKQKSYYDFSLKTRAHY